MININNTEITDMLLKNWSAFFVSVFVSIYLFCLEIRALQQEINEAKANSNWTKAKNLKKDLDQAKSVLDETRSAKAASGSDGPKDKVFRSSSACSNCIYFYLFAVSKCLSIFVYWKGSSSSEQATTLSAEPAATASTAPQGKIDVTNKEVIILEKLECNRNV